METCSCTEEIQKKNMTYYDYLFRLRLTLRKKVLNDNDSVNKVHTFEQKSVRNPLK